MTSPKWPTGPEYFQQTNVEAIVRGLDRCNYVLMGMPDNSPTHKNMSLMINFPALANKKDINDEKNRID